MQTDKATDKIAKLLRLADKAGTPEESATAFALAQEMMTRHAISEAQVRAAAIAGGLKAEEPIVSRVIWSPSGKQIPTWVSCLASAVCAANGCAPIVDRTGRIPAIKAWGQSADLTKAADLLGAIVGQIEALAKRSPFRGRTALNNFRIGAMQTVTSRIKQGRSKALADAKDSACAVTAQALVLVQGASERAEGQLRLDCGHIRSAGRASFRSDYEAKAAGRRAGHSVNVSGNRALR